jgi:hypothetical protein
MIQETRIRPQNRAPACFAGRFWLVTENRVKLATGVRISK